MTVADYFCKQEFHGLKQGSMTDKLNALGTIITNKHLVQNTLRGLGSKLAYMRTLTLKQRPLPSVLDVRLSLLLEELTLQ
jgi:hypothetical protein